MKCLYLGTLWWSLLGTLWWLHQCYQYAYLRFSRTVASEVAGCFRCCLREGLPRPRVSFAVFLFLHRYAGPVGLPGYDRHLKSALLITTFCFYRKCDKEIVHALSYIIRDTNEKVNIWGICFLDYTSIHTCIQLNRRCCCKRGISCVTCKGMCHYDKIKE